MNKYFLLLLILNIQIGNSQDYLSFPLEFSSGREVFHGSNSFVLNEDKSFYWVSKSISCVIGDENFKVPSITEIIGVYEQSGNDLFLIPNKYFNQNYKNEREIIIGTDSILQKTSMSQRFKIIYDKRTVFLLNNREISKLRAYRNYETNDILKIINFVNGKRKNKDDLYVKSTNNALRDLSFRSYEKLKSMIPIEYKSYILESPIFTDVLSRERKMTKSNGVEILDEIMFTLDKGYKDGIREGMKLYGYDLESKNKKEKAKEVCCIFVQEVDKNRSKGRIKVAHKDRHTKKFDNLFFTSM